MGQLFLAKSSRFTRQLRPKARWDEDQQSFESFSDGLNMTLMLIHLTFWPAPKKDSFWNVQLWQQTQTFTDAAATALQD